MNLPLLQDFNMTIYKPSRIVLFDKVIVGLILFCPTFGLWSIVTFFQLWNHYSKTLIIDETGVRYKKGILNITTTELKFKNINSVNISQALFGRILDFGDIVITTGNDTSGIVFGPVDRPEFIKMEIDKYI